MATYLFHEDIPEDYIRKVFEVIRQAPQHTVQMLTKRAERMAVFSENYEPPKNAWPRLDWLRQVGKVDLTGIHWVIVGGETGPKARPMQQEWVLNIKRQCDEQHSAFFFKQWGGWGVAGKKRVKEQNGRLLQGITWVAVPATASNTQMHA